VLGLDRVCNINHDLHHVKPPRYSSSRSRHSTRHHSTRHHRTSLHQLIEHSASNGILHLSSLGPSNLTCTPKCSSLGPSYLTCTPKCSSLGPSNLTCTPKCCTAPSPPPCATSGPLKTWSTFRAAFQTMVARALVREPVYDFRVEFGLGLHAVDFSVDMSPWQPPTPAVMAKVEKTLVKKLVGSGQLMHADAAAKMSQVLDSMALSRCAAAPPLLCFFARPQFSLVGGSVLMTLPSAYALVPCQQTGRLELCLLWRHSEQCGWGYYHLASFDSLFVFVDLVVLKTNGAVRFIRLVGCACLHHQCAGTRRRARAPSTSSSTET
jgi:hypothetical protein